MMDTNRPNPGLCRIPIRVLVAICVMAALTTAAEAFQFKPPAETAHERAGTGAPHPGQGSRDPAGRDDRVPEIVLVSPRSLKKISSPLEIELRFLTKPPSKIVRDSLRVFYGFFGFDITDRLTRNAEVTRSGIVARNADLPAGSHSITIEISDDRDRIARRTFQFEIEDGNE